MGAWYRHGAGMVPGMVQAWYRHGAGMVPLRVLQAVGVEPTGGPTVGLHFQDFPFFSIFFSKEFFFSKEKIIFSKVVRLTKKMIFILTLSRKRKFRFFRDPNCGPTVGCGPNI